MKKVLKRKMTKHNESYWVHVKKVAKEVSSWPEPKKVGVVVKEHSAEMWKKDEYELFETKLGPALSLKSKKVPGKNKWGGNIHKGYLVKFNKFQMMSEPFEVAGYSLLPYTWETVLVCKDREVNDKEPEEIAHWCGLKVLEGSEGFEEITELLLEEEKKRLERREEDIKGCAQSVYIWEKCLASAVERKVETERYVKELSDRLDKHRLGSQNLIDFSQAIKESIRDILRNNYLPDTLEEFKLWAHPDTTKVLDIYWNNPQEYEGFVAKGEVNGIEYHVIVGEKIPGINNGMQLTLRATR